MSKPLKDWTLGEVQEECKKHGNCGGNCKIWKERHGACELTDTTPDNWDLTDTPALTPDELAVCRLLKRADATLIEKTDFDVYVQDSKRTVRVAIPPILFPSIRLGDTLDLTTMDLGGCE